MNRTRRSTSARQPPPTPPARPLQPGDDAATAVLTLLRDHGDRIHALARRLRGNAADADDLSQEVFMQAFRKWHTFRGDADPGTWLYTIALRAGSPRRRLKGSGDRRVPALSQLLPWGETTLMAAVADDGAGAMAERREAIETVQRHVASLPEHLRVPLVLKEVLGVSVDEVARTLGLAENTIKTRLHRARLALRKTMTENARTVDAPAPIYEKQVCLDLMKAKMAAMDAGRAFAVPQAELCARCRGVFRELDFVHDACARMAEGTLPTAVRQAVLDALEKRDAAARGGITRRGRRPVTPP